MEGRLAVESVKAAAVGGGRALNTRGKKIGKIGGGEGAEGGKRGQHG